MKFKTFSTLLISSIICTFILIPSCAIEVEDTNDEIQEKFIKAYIEKYYPGYEPDEDGIYVIEHKTTQGERVDSYDSCYAVVQYSIRSLDKTYIYSSYDSVAQKIGQYSPSIYYGSHIWSIGQDLNAIGLEKVVSKLQVGGSISAIIPPEMLGETFSGDLTNSDGNYKLYEIQLDSIILDIDEHQSNLMQAYSDKYYDGMDTTNANYYFKKIHTNAIVDTIENSNTVYLNYIGRLLNGLVFDTNIADTAMKYGIYDPARDYTTGFDFSYFKDSVDVLLNNSDIATGFIRTAWKLNYGDKAIAFFSSDYGYGDYGNISEGGSIPSYSPLFFEVWMENLERKPNVEPAETAKTSNNITMSK